MKEYIKELILSLLGIGAAGVTFFWYKKNSTIANKGENNTITSTSNIHNYNNSNVTIVENSSANVGKENRGKHLSKDDVQILFVDDKEFEVVKLLKKVGWRHCKRIKDVLDLGHPDIKSANIIFIDIQGVGANLFPSEEGFGLCREIRKKYPNKYIVIYSAEANRFHENMKYADAILDKNTNPQAFISILEEYLEKRNESKDNR